MKKWKKIAFKVVGVIILLLVIDMIWIFFIGKPLFAIQKENNGSLNRVYSGIIYNTYYCMEDSTVIIIAKGSKFSCPSDKITKLHNYDFSVSFDSEAERKKTFAFVHDNISYYYGTTDFTLYLTINKYKFSIERVLTNNMLNFNDILEKNVKVETVEVDGSKLYHYNNFNIIVCNTNAGNNDVIIGDTEMKIEDFCN